MKTVMFIILFSLYLLVTQARAEIDWSGHSFYLGINRPNYRLSVKDNDKKIETKMVRDEELYLSVGYQSSPKPLYYDFFRWSLEFSLSPYRANRQIADRVVDVAGEYSNGEGKEVDLSTEVKGLVTYINPTVGLYYEFKPLYYVYFGIGFGLGFANISGTYYQLDANSSSLCLESTTINTIKNNCSRENIKFKRMSASANVTLNIVLNHFIMRYERGGPEIKKNNKRYEVHNEFFIFGYLHHF
jgi:hypothetical protein